MSYRQFIFVILLGSALAWGALWSVIVSIDPQTSGLIGPILFYSTLFFAAGGTFGLVALFIRHLRDRKTIASRQVSDSLRQGIWLSLLLLIHLALFQWRLASWVTSIPLILFFAALEAIWQSFVRPAAVPSARS